MSAYSEPPGGAEEPLFHPCPPDPSCPYCTGSIDAGHGLDWSFLDGVYCISLKSREDRATRVSKEFHRVGLCQKVMFYRPLRGPEKSVIGIWISHRAVSMDALQRGYERTLIMEDDVLFSTRLRPRKLRATRRAIARLPTDWMIFFLGHWPVLAYPIKHNVLRTRSACAHAYIVSPRLLRWLSDHPWETPGIKKRALVGKGLDAAYAELPGTYAIFPMIATQSVSKSDHFNSRTKPVRRLKHLVTHSRHRELLLSRLMRPAEMTVFALSLLFFATRAIGRVASRHRPPV